MFVAINSGLANPASDILMPILTNSWFLRTVLAVIFLALLIFGKRRGRLAAIGCLLTVALSDQISAQLLKPIFERIRPCHVLADVHLLVNCSQGLSFPSSHAANTFGQAAFLGVLFPRWRWYLVAFAALVSYSRIAVGVHYPLDVLAGTGVGILAGLLVLFAWRLSEQRWPRVFAPKSTPPRVSL